MDESAKLKDNIARRMTATLHLSEDILERAMIVTTYGTYRLCVENFKALSEYSDCYIRILGVNDKLEIKGQDLQLQYFHEDGLCVIGNIKSVDYK